MVRIHEIALAIDEMLLCFIFIPFWTLVDHKEVIPLNMSWEQNSRRTSLLSGRNYPMVGRIVAERGPARNKEARTNSIYRRITQCRLEDALKGYGIRHLSYTTRINGQGTPT